MRNILHTKLIVNTSDFLLPFNKYYLPSALTDNLSM